MKAVAGAQVTIRYDVWRTVRILAAERDVPEKAIIYGMVNDALVAIGRPRVADSPVSFRREEMRRRNIATKRDQRQRGRYLGGAAPMGFKPVHCKDPTHFIIDRKTYPLRCRIIALARAGLSCRAIRHALAGDGVALALTTVWRVSRFAASEPEPDASGLVPIASFSRE